MYVCVWIYIYIYIYTLSIYLSIYLSLSLSLYIYIYIYIYPNARFKAPGSRMTSQPCLFENRRKNDWLGEPPEPRQRPELSPSPLEAISVVRQNKHVILKRSL